MTSTDTEDRSGGSVPHAYRQKLSWQWAKEMPRPLRGGFLTLLYALGSLADKAGYVRFARDRKPVRISDIAAAAGCDENDARRYLHAAEIAGVVVVEGERRRGRPTLYVVSAVIQYPDWAAAVDALAATKRRREGRTAPVWKPEEFRGPTPVLPEAKFMGPTPELERDPGLEVPGTAPGMSSGDRPRIGSGDRPRNNPGSTQEVSQGAVADVVALPQPPQAASPRETTPNTYTAESLGPARCAVCHERMLARPGRNTHTHCARDKPA